VIAKLMGKDGPFLCGKEVSLADATVFPSIVFASFMFPKFDHGLAHPPIPKEIEEWYQNLIETDIAFHRVYEEVK
jgi:glutathione S-transferase